MLVLSRKRNEIVVIGPSKTKTRVVVLEIQGTRVRLGFDADRETSIHREEIWIEMEKEHGKQADGKPG